MGANKRKYITIGLVILIVILCMMSFYMVWQFNHMQIAYNRVNREQTMLKSDYTRLVDDYEKLYRAYYSYDKKILKLLEGRKDVFWAKDSSAYVVRSNGVFLFSFYKKPKMPQTHYLWSSDGEDEYKLYGKYEDHGAIDTLKPHQIFTGKSSGKEKLFLVAEIHSENASRNNPDSPITIIRIK